MNIDYEKYKIDRDSIFKQYFNKNNDFTDNTFESIILNIQLFLNFDPIKNSLDEKFEFVNSLLSFGAMQDDKEIVEYLLYSKDLPVIPNLEYNNHEALMYSCVYNAQNVGKILVKEFYEQFKNAKTPEERERYILPEIVFNEACFNNCSEIVQQILDYPKEFYIENIKIGFHRACLSGNFELSDKLFNASIEIQDEQLLSPILDQFPYYHNIYQIIAFNDKLVNMEKKIEIISYIVNNSLLDINNYNNYIRHTPIEHVLPNDVLKLCYNHSHINMMEFLLNHNKTKNSFQSLMNQDLIKDIVEFPPYPEYKQVINYFINEIGICRTEELYFHLKDICENETIERRKEIAQAIVDLYDIVEFHDKLEKKIESKETTVKKKKL